MGRADQFSYSPNENDPQLLLEKRRALEQGARDRSSTMDELNRAGLMGSSAAFGALGESDARTGRSLEDITAGAYNHQRDEQFQLFRDRLDFERQMKLQHMQQMAGALGGLGELAGSFIPGVNQLSHLGGMRSRNMYAPTPYAGGGFDYGAMSGAY